ncbi:uncharacterized protein ACR2FA_009265 [Aphomia sociella]
MFLVVVSMIAFLIASGFADGTSCPFDAHIEDTDVILDFQAVCTSLGYNDPVSPRIISSEFVSVSTNDAGNKVKLNIDGICLLLGYTTPVFLTTTPTTEISTTSSKTPLAPIPTTATSTTSTTTTTPPVHIPTTATSTTSTATTTPPVHIPTTATSTTSTATTTPPMRIPTTATSTTSTTTTTPPVHKKDSTVSTVASAEGALKSHVNQMATKTPMEKKYIIILIGSLAAATCVILISKFIYSKYRRSYVLPESRNMEMSCNNI